MERYFIAELFPKGMYDIWDRETGKTIVGKVEGCALAESICNLLNRQVVKEEDPESDVVSVLRRDNAILKQWKEEASEVLDNLNLQEIGKVLDIRPGNSISEQVLPGIIKMKNRIEELEAVLAKCVKTGLSDRPEDIITLQELLDVLKGGEDG